MNPKKVTLVIVKRLYVLHTIKGVNEAWKEGIGWFTTANGKKINDQGTPEQQVLFCEAIGATKVQLHLEIKIRDLNHKVLADFNLSDLIE